MIMNGYALESEAEDKKIAKKIIRKFKPVAKGTLYEEYLDQLITLKTETSDKLKSLKIFDQAKRYSLVVHLIDQVLKDISDNDILEILEVLIEDIRVNSLEEFLELSSLKDKFLEYKNSILPDSSTQLVKSTLKYYNISYADTKRTLEDKIIEHIESSYSFPSVKNLNKEIEEFLEYKLFFENFDLYLKKGKYADTLKQLAVSIVPVRGKWNTNKSPLEGFQGLFLIENKSEFLDALNERLNHFSISSAKETIYHLIEDKEEIKSLISNNPNVIYSFTVAKETAKNYYLNREKLIYAKEEDNKYVSDFLYYFKQILLSKEYDAVLNVGEKLVIVETDYGEQIIKEEDYNQFKDITDLDSKISACSKKDILKIGDYFVQTLSQKTLDNFEELNTIKESKIKELEKEYCAISMPTHEELLEACDNLYSLEYSLKKVLKFDEREKIGSKLREEKKSLENSSSNLKNCKAFTKSTVNLTKKQKLAAEAIFIKYYSEEEQILDYNFRFEDKESEKRNILKTICVKSDFDFS